MGEIAWHTQARRMLMSGAYPSKAAIARELGVSVGHLYEVLSMDGGAAVTASRLARQHQKYHTDQKHRERLKQRVRDARSRRQSYKGTGKYPLHIRCDGQFLALLDGWISRDGREVTRPEAVRHLVRRAIAASTSETTP